MSFGTPTSEPASGATYHISFNTTSEPVLSFSVTTGKVPIYLPPLVPPTEAERDAAAQAVVDLIDGSSDFTLVAAVKEYPTTQEITPTP